MCEKNEIHVNTEHHCTTAFPIKHRVNEKSRLNELVIKIKRMKQYA